MKTIKRKLGFSLVEVVVSVGIFAVAIVGIIGLFAPTTKNVAAVADSDSSTRAVEAIQAYWQGIASSPASADPTKSGFSKTIPDAFSAGYVFYANKGGDKVGRAADLPTLSDRFFEFSLTRNGDSPNTGDGLSPVGNDNTAGFLAFMINLRWPAYLPNGVPVTDNSQKSTLIIPAAVTR